jgi:hypothetical protein
MLGIFKKLFSSEKKIETTTSKNQLLIEKVQILAYNENLHELLNVPENKILILNVYYVTFENLLFNIVNKVDERQITSVNLYSYFNETKDVNYALKRIIPILEKNDINIKVKHDLEELINSIEFLMNIEEEV